eukprot:gb/GFBE01056915.1/.p1 GENE.gb/GFBE01056915.1/~~gb/GFBE01056915.1/.p1  ORF type:complete len:743 (+),score=167.00 gb/GFBE01056915.1/:1-2229(+)
MTRAVRLARSCFDSSARRFELGVLNPRRDLRRLASTHGEALFPSAASAEKQDWTAPVDRNAPDPGASGSRGAWKHKRAAAGAQQVDLSEEIQKLRQAKDCLAFFLEKRDFISPGDVCLLLESLWLKTVEEQGEEGLLASKKELFNNADFMAILKDVVFKIERYGPKELPRLLAVLHDMHWHDKHLFKIAEPMVMKHLPSVQLVDLPRLSSAFIGVRCGSRLLFNELVHRCSQAAVDLKPDALSTLVSAFARSPHKPKVFLTTFSPVVSAQMHLFSQDQLAKVLVAYSEWPREVSIDFADQLIELLCRDEGAMLRSGLAPGHVVAVLRALALWKSRAKSARANPAAWNKASLVRVFRLSAQPIFDGRGELTPEQTAAAMWAYGKMGAVPRTLFSALYRDVLKSHKAISMPSLASCLLNSARAVCGQLRSWNDQPAESSGSAGRALCDRKLLDVAEARVQKDVGDMAVRDMTAVVLSYSLAHAGSAELFSVLQRACLDRCRQFPMEQLATLLWSFATIRLGPSFFKEAQFDVLEKINQLSIPAVCDVIWSYCAARHRDPHFFKALLSVLVPSRVAGNPRCALLYPALLELRVHFPEMDPEGIERYMGYALPDFHRMQLSAAAPEAAIHGLKEALDRMEVKYDVLVDIDGYVADVVVFADQEEYTKPVVILYHSAPRTLHFRTNEPLGQTMMKQRLLRSRGFGVVNLWNETWDTLTAEERANELVGKLQQAQKQPTGRASVSEAS